MIEKQEIDDKAAKFEIHTSNVQRDYVFGWLLKAIFQNEYLSGILILKGGNCFRKIYFPETRFSSDLDFSTQVSIDINRLKTELDSSCNTAHEMSGVSFEIDRNKVVQDRVIDKETSIYKAKIYFKDFYGKEGSIIISVRLDITEFDKIHLPIQTRPLVHPYSDFSLCTGDIKCLALEELVANKMKCLIQRRHSHDLYDIVYTVFFDHQIEIDRTSVISTFLRKTIFSPNPGSAKQILLGLPIPFFKAAWEKYIVCPIQSRINFDEGISKFRAFIEEIFAITGRGDDISAAFFPAELRNLILDAGSQKKLMRITYSGYERIIEPYALTYKRRTDGVAREYFYAWDRTGGSSGEIGIKTFLNPKIENLQVAEEVFEPQFEIELSKAGEATGKGYFQKTFGQKRKNVGVGRGFSAFGSGGFLSNERKYVTVCNSCGKRFPRKKRSTKINKHKTPEGYDCFGRYGLIEY